jgi:hypothetical protein
MEQKKSEVRSRNGFESQNPCQNQEHLLLKTSISSIEASKDILIEILWSASGNYDTMLLIKPGCEFLKLSAS